MSDIGAELAKVFKKITPTRTERDKVANEIRWARKEERKGNNASWENRRELRNYDEILMGFKKSLDYVRNNFSVLKSKIFVDVGAGMGKAAAQLRQEEWGDDLDIHTTNVTRMQKNNEQEHLTSAEEMRGFAPESVAYICSVMGVAYSGNPETAMRKLHEILVPGGVMKLAFRDSGRLRKIVSVARRRQRSDKFIDILLDLGYLPNKDFAVKKNHGMKVILAIKPGSDLKIRADNLMDQDYQDFWARRPYG